MANVHTQQLGRVLVTGGSGFVGARIINDFVVDPRWTLFQWFREIRRINP